MKMDCGSEVVLTGPGIKVARWTLRILELWSIQLDSGYEVDNIGPMSAGELRFAVKARQYLAVYRYVLLYLAAGDIKILEGVSFRY